MKETKLDDENLLLLNQPDFENFNKMKNYNIFECKHIFDDFEINIID
jgi:hypothetical protein